MIPHDWKVRRCGSESGRRTTYCRRCGCERWGSEIVVLKDGRPVGTAGDDCGLVVVRKVLES